MQILRIFPALILFFLFFSSETFAVSGSTETIRVAIRKGTESIRIEGIALEARDSFGARLDLSSPLTIRRDGRDIFVGGVLLQSLTVSSPGIQQVNGKGYRGVIEVYPYGKRSLLVVDELPLEEYLVGLINCEISSQWPIEAIKAQAVVARSFALFQKQSRKNLLYHLESTVYDQVYGGCDIEDSRAARAVEETRGQVLVYDGRIVQAFYHSSCGGHTENVENVWSFSRPYLHGVVCNYCRKSSSPSVFWERTLSPEKIESLFRSAGYQMRGLRQIRAKSHYSSGRIENLELVSTDGAITIPAVAFRKIVGYGVIRSTAFQVALIDNEFVFTGVGNGHGVGLCQWGAKQRAEEGFNYREILSYYYPGIHIADFYTD